MLIVHNDRKILIPNGDPSFYAFDSLPDCHLLVVYYADKQMFHSQIREYHQLVRQMAIHNTIDLFMLRNLKNMTIPDVTRMIPSDVLLDCMNNGVIFHDGTKSITCGSITEVNLTSPDPFSLDKFTGLRKLSFTSKFMSNIVLPSSLDHLEELSIPKLSEPASVLKKCKVLKKLTMTCSNNFFNYIGTHRSILETLEEWNFVGLHNDILPQRLYECKKLRILTMTSMYRAFLRLQPSHPICDTLTELTMDYSSVEVTNLRFFRNVRKLRMREYKQDLDFITADHPFCDSVRELDLLLADVTDARLVHFRNLRVLNVGCANISLQFIRDSHGRHPMCNTLEELRADYLTSLEDDSLKYFRNLRKLTISETNCSLSFVTADHPICLLEELICNVSKVTDQALQHFTNLRVLSVIDCEVDLAFVKPGHPMCDLLELHATHINITDDTLQHFTQLHTLNVGSFPVTLSFVLKGVDSHRRSNTLCDSLTHLDVSGSNVDQATLRHFRNLRSLRIDDGMNMLFLTDEGKIDICHPMYQLEDLDASLSALTDENLQYFQRLQKLDVLYTDIQMGFLTPAHPLCETLVELKNFDRGGIRQVPSDKISMFRRLTEI